jgi:acyl carrier protein
MSTISQDSVFGTLASLIRRIAGKRATTDVGPDTRFVEDLGFDSVIAIRMMLELERTFGIDVAARSDEINIADIVTVRDLASLVQRLS